MLMAILKRLLGSLPLILGISVVVFALMHLMPGDPIGAMLFEYAGDAATAEKLRDQLGLNDPIYVQFLDFLAGALRGDLGNSLITSRPVVDEFLTYLPVTIKLSALALFLAVVIGITLGVVAAIARDSWIDQLVMLGSLAGVSMPIFFSGVLLIQVFSIWLGWLPVTYRSDGATGLILPAIALALMPAAMIARLTRSNMLEVLPQDYIRTARAKGLSSYVIISRHGLRNALIPIITVVGLQLGNLLSGAVVAEAVFTVPGIGTLIINAIEQRDYLVVQGAVLYISVIYVILNMTVDIMYNLVDPRTRR